HILSNFYPASFTINGNLYPTVEHYFQSQKFEDEAIQKSIRDARTAYEAKRLGRFLPYLRQDWDSIRIAVMEEGLRAKFAQNIGARQYLISTQDLVLVE